MSGLLVVACGAPVSESRVSPTPTDDTTSESSTGATSAPISDATPSASPEAPKATAAPSTDPTPSAVEEPSAPVKDRSYAFVVSFISPGDGTDHAAYERLLALVKATPKPLHWALGHWGKEGEHDACFDLAELSSSEKTAFIAAVKKQVGGSPKVQIHEKAVCNSR